MSQRERITRLISERHERINKLIDGCFGPSLKELKTKHCHDRALKLAIRELDKQTVRMNKKYDHRIRVLRREVYGVRGKSA